MDTAYLAKHKHVEVLGLCDVDYKHGKIDTWSKQFKSATAFQDYREMLAELGDKVDAVSISTLITPLPAPWRPWNWQARLHPEASHAQTIRSPSPRKVRQEKGPDHPNGNPKSIP